MNKVTFFERLKLETPKLYKNIRKTCVGVAVSALSTLALSELPFVEINENAKNILNSSAIIATFVSTIIATLAQGQVTETALEDYVRSKQTPNN